MIFSIALAGIVLLLQFYNWAPLGALLPAVGVFCVVLYVYLRRNRHSHGGFLSIDYYAQVSRLHSLHPAIKTGLCLIAIVLCLAANSLPLCAFVFFSMGCITVWIGKTPLFYYISLILLPLSFVLLSGLALLIQFSGEPLGYLDIPVFSLYLSVTRASQDMALAVMAKALASVTCLYMLSLSTPVNDLISLMRRVRVPAILIELMYLIYRYIFVLLEILNGMNQAAAARLGFRDKRTTLKTSLLCASNLMQLSFKQASANYDAMEARCYDGQIQFLDSLYKIKTREILPAAVYVVLLVLISLPAYF